MLHPGRPKVRRAFDFTVAAIALWLLSPVLLLLGALTKFTSAGPAIHRARRMGLGGRSFVLYKFRTMVVGADKIGPGVTGSADPRITRLGAVLRSAKLDELPQLVNVLRGEMSFVGPRPEDPRYLPYYRREHLSLLDVLPGITSAASLDHMDEQELLRGDDYERVYVERVLCRKLDQELASVGRSSVASEILMVFRTIRRLAAHAVPRSRLC